MSFRELVPEKKEYWHYDEETGLLLVNNGEYGWVAHNSLQKARDELQELQTAIESASESGLVEPSSVLPLPSNQ